MNHPPMRRPAARLLVLLAIVAAALTLAPTRSRAAAERPNVLFIAIDDLNDWIGCLDGHPQVKTPNIDRLARRGTLFASAHCQAPLCNPSRASLLTGMRPSTTGVYALDPWFRTADSWRDHITLPQYFAANGYRTLTTGKIFHDAYPPAARRTDGLEFSEWGYHGNMGPRPPQKFVTTPDPNPLVDWGVYPPRDEDQEDWKVADWAISRLRAPQIREQPFFLSVGFRRPHVPCYASQKWFDLYPEQTLVMPPVKPDDRSDTPRFSWYLHWKLPEPRLGWLERERQWRPFVRGYLASISFVDSQVGRVLDALEASGQADRTIVVLWSDHGFHMGEKGISGKNTLWERSTRVPLIFAGRGVKAGARCERPVELLDMYPTLAELAGLPVKGGLDGHSLAPLLKDAKAPRAWPALTSHGPNNHSVRTEKWRYIRYADGSEELYDEKQDPNEWTNLAAKPEHAGTKRELARWLPQVNAAPLPGGTTRLIELRNGLPFWEGKPIGAADPIPNDLED
ncbi:MAG: arylsulfatase family protein [Armatimonadetes bacterium]|nr:arylsulfatase family protein [Armatimonadota bacterium]